MAQPHETGQIGDPNLKRIVDGQNPAISRRTLFGKLGTVFQDLKASSQQPVANPEQMMLTSRDARIRIPAVAAGGVLLSQIPGFLRADHASASDTEIVPALVLPEAGVAGAVTTRELPKNAIPISGNAWIGDAPVGFQGAVDRQIQIDAQNGIDRHAALGDLKGDKGKTIYVKADDGSYIPVQVYERGVLHMWQDTDNMLNVVRKSTESDLFNGFFTVQEGNSVIASMDAETVAALARTPVVGDPNSSRTPTIPDLRKVSNYDGDIQKLETPQVGQNVKMVIEKSTNGAIIREAKPEDKIPAQLLDVVIGEHTSGHNIPVKVREFLKTNFNGHDVEQLGLPLTPYFLTPTKIEGQDTWVILGIHERGRVTIRVDKYGELQVEGGLSGNNWLAAINQGRTDINPGQPGPSPEPTPPPTEKHLTEPRTKFRKTAGSIINGKEYPGMTDSSVGITNTVQPIDPEFAGMVWMYTRIKSINRNSKTADIYIDQGNSIVKIHLPDSVSDTNNRFARAQKTTYNVPITWNDQYIYNAANAYIDIEGENPSQNIVGDIAMLFFSKDEFSKLKNNTANIAGFTIYV